MVGEWPIIRLGDYVDSSLGKMLDAQKNKGQLQPYLGNSNVRWGTFDLADLAQMKFEEHEEERYGIRDGDLIVCEGGEPGRCAVWREEIPNMKIQKALHRIRTRNELNNYYLFYWFMLAGKTGRLEPYFTGTTIKHLTGKAVSALELPLPPIVVQEEIAGILKSLDDKIELNRRMNETLEAIVRAIFKSWFVDFDPVRAKARGEPPESICRRLGLTPDLLSLFPDRLVDSELGEIPEGWEWSSIGEEVSILGGGTPSTTSPEFWNGEYAWVTPKDLSGASAKVLIGSERKITQAGVKKISSGQLPIGTVLLSSRAPIGYLSLAMIPVSINQGFIAMVCDKRLPNTYVLQWAIENLDAIKQRGSGTTFAEISKTNFRPMVVLVPGERVLESFHQHAMPLYEQITAKVRESETLGVVRDTLLPKLLSGELRVSEADSNTEACA